MMLLIVIPSGVQALLHDSPSDSLISMEPSLCNDDVTVPVEVTSSTGIASDDVSIFSMHIITSK